MVLKVTASVVLTYGGYSPADFEAEFLIGRAGYFFGVYSWSFYAHIVVGPTTLIVGLLLMSERFRARFTLWHRRLGRVQVVCVLVVSISGLWMSQYAATGMIAGFGFACLSIAMGTFVVLGFRSAINRKFATHRCWMWRCYLMLCSAVVLRLIAGLATVMGVEGDWIYQVAAWGSWLVPLGVYEVRRLWFGE